MTVYRINLYNYHGYSNFELYHHKENAIQRLTKIWKEAKTKEQFNGDTIEEFSFFDPEYNSYDTYITFYETSFEKLFCDKA